jgi:ATP:ADP antiporter, AAA family
MNSKEHMSWWRIGGLGLTGYLVLLSYSIARPPVESLFLATYTEEGLPWVWLMQPVFTLATVLIYNRYAAVWSLGELYIMACTLSSLCLIGLQVAYAVLPDWTLFALYLWKDIYIVVLIEIFWSTANHTYDLNNAKKTYGLFMACGTLGSLTGDVMVGHLAHNLGWGSINTLWLVIPILMLSAWVFSRMDTLDRGDVHQPKPPSIADGLRVLEKSSYLGWLVALILCVQIAITLIDYQYSGILREQNFSADQQTQVIGWIYAGINVAAFIFQLCTALLLKILGVGGVLMLVPVFLGGAMLGFMLLPRFASVVFVKWGSKVFDYSIFRAGKEMLYLPLSYKEKTQGKAVVDMFAYRFAKAVTSFILLGLIALGFTTSIAPVTILCVAMWASVTLVVLRRYNKALQERTRQ